MAAVQFSLKSSTTTRRNGQPSTTFQIHLTPKDTNPLTRPFLLSSEMEHLQLTFGAIRPLKKTLDDDAEAGYRRRTYDVYDTALALLSTSSTVGKTASETIISSLALAHQTFDAFFRFLAGEVEPEMARPTTGRGELVDLLAERVGGLDDRLVECFLEGCEASLHDLHVEMRELDRAAVQLVATMQTSCCDGILNLGECERVVEEMGKRERELRARFEEMQVLVWDGKEWGRRMCAAVAQLMGGWCGRLEAEQGEGQGQLEELVNVVEDIAEAIGDHGGIVGMMREREEDEMD